MEEEVRHGKALKVVEAGEIQLPQPAFDDDWSLLRAFEILLLEAAEIVAGLGDPAMEVSECLLRILVARDLAPGETRRRALGMIARKLHLVLQRKHVGRQPRI